MAVYSFVLKLFSPEIVAFAAAPVGRMRCELKDKSKMRKRLGPGNSLP
jgi:hypothetical protein